MESDSQSPAGHLILNLERYVRLSADDRAALDVLRSVPVLEARARGDIIREGDRPNVVRLMVDGWAYRYKDLPDGRRQIVGFFIPGDFCDLNVYIFKEMDHSIGAITRVGYVQITPDEMERVMGERPRIARALLCHELVSAAVLREWLLNVGQRTARERIAHLLVELFVRLRTVGLTHGATCDFPITQTDIGEATGLTSVHVNRTLQEFGRVDVWVNAAGVMSYGALDDTPIATQRRIIEVNLLASCGAPVRCYPR